VISSAEFSQDRSLRFVLTRIWDIKKEIVCYIGLNPSNADDISNDPTVKKLIQISRYNNIGGFHLINLYPYITSDPIKLQGKMKDGRARNLLLIQEFTKQNKTICIWGNHATKDGFVEAVLKLLKGGSHCLRTNKTGMPSHPLYLPTKTKFEAYKKVPL